MKFLCVPCDGAMRLQETSPPDQAGSLTLLLRCPSCGHETAILTNAGETQLVSSLGVRIGPTAGDAAPGPMQHLVAGLSAMRDDAVHESGTDEITWTPEALARLGAAPTFVQPMIRKSYADYARRHGLREITVEVMDRAREEIGM